MEETEIVSNRSNVGDLDSPFETLERDPRILLAELLCNETAYVPSNESASFCPKTFDGWSCWNETAPGNTAYASCPYFITGFDPKRMAHKECLENGTWFRHPETNMIWSNYTTCVDLEGLYRAQTVITIYEVGYLISICALAVSLLIFCSFRCLECTRVRIHKNLFVSFIINNVLWLIWYRCVINRGIPTDQQNQISCVTLHIFVNYFMVANYFWMFCEGFYLHTLLVYSFTRAESKLLRGFYVFGWLGPSIPMTFYVIFRATDPNPDEQKGCWDLTESQWKLFLTIPVCFGLITSLAFLINILRVLLAKLNDNRRNFAVAANRRESNIGDSQNALRKEDRDILILPPTLLFGTIPSMRNSRTSCTSDLRISGVLQNIMQASRATLILIPLLGLHYFLIPFRPDAEDNPEWTKVYEYFAAVSSSIQGLCVSLLFCFCNGEVLSVLRRTFCHRYCPGSSYRAEYSCAPTSMTVNKSTKQQPASQFV